MSTDARIALLPPGAVRVELSGEFDVASKATLQTYLGDAIHLSSDIVLDMHAVEFLDCAALGVLLRARNRVVALGGTLTVVAPSRQVTLILDLAGLGGAFCVRVDEPAALTA